MTVRIIEESTLHNRREELALWLAANGIVPDQVALQAIVIEDKPDGTSSISYAAFVLTDDGQRQRDPQAPDWVWTERRSAPLTRSPDAVALAGLTR